MTNQITNYANIFLSKRKNTTYTTSFYDELLQPKNIPALNDFLLSTKDIRIFDNFTIEECEYILRKGITTDIKDSRGKNIWFNIKSTAVANIFYRYNQNINMPDEQGNVPVKYARTEMLNFFISRGVKLDYVNKKGCNLLWFSHEKETELLLKYGLNVNHTNKDGENCLFIKSFNIMDVSDIREHHYLSKAKTNILIKNNIDINIKDVNNRNALIGLEGLHSDIIKTLIENGIDYEGYSLPDELQDFISNFEKKKLQSSIVMKNNKKPDSKRL